MSRIRSIKPEIWLSEDYQNLSPAGRLAFVYMITNADDHGRLRTSPAHLTRNAVGAAVEVAEVGEQLALMVAQGMVTVYIVAHASYAQLLHWNEHQRVSHPRESVLPPPPARTRRKIPENSGGRTKIPALSIDRSIDLPNDLSGEAAARSKDRERVLLWLVEQNQESDYPNGNRLCVSEGYPAEVVISSCEEARDKWSARGRWLTYIQKATDGGSSILSRHLSAWNQRESSWDDATGRLKTQRGASGAGASSASEIAEELVEAMQA
jgi:hypothetical protein